MITPMPLPAWGAGAFSVIANAPAWSALGEMRRRTARTLSWRPPRAIRKRTDSGSSSAISTATSTGAAPPSISTLRQPRCGIIHAARKPPKAAPSGKPQNMALVSMARLPSGQYSLIRLTAFGIAAPRPRPVTKRSSASSSRLVAKADHRQDTPNSSTDVARISLRPRRSDSGPAKMAPAARPNRAALSTGASAGRVTPQSLISDGAMKPMAAVSKPSSSTIRKHRPNAATPWPP